MHLVGVRGVGAVGNNKRSRHRSAVDDQRKSSQGVQFLRKTAQAVERDATFPQRGNRPTGIKRRIAGSTKPQTVKPQPETELVQHIPRTDED
ncbi:hypothetical protein [Accumulibacter sp.]|uniref:hypothetical protein n=1 Tax=Accumulibacter sp. TaxID=2053492 RepID=UPI002D13ED1B|nr:hypothetical protein [Accumulibacter sp.]HNH92613.1 hypothetical protein [Accumulibacter sp.]